MRKLLAFLIRYSVVIIFLLLETIAFVMIIKNNDYQKSVFFSSGNTVLASMYEVSNSVVEFFSLKSANEGLAEENTLLKNQLVELQNQLGAVQQPVAQTGNIHISPDKEVSYILAKVINNSTNKTRNFITLNKGSRDGIMPDMGVINEDGVVGFVARVSEKFSVVLPVLNPKFSIIGKFLKHNYSGPVVWEGADYRYGSLRDIARHVQFALGDSLVTSGYTKSFPEGIPIGTVDDFKISEGETYYDIRLKLAVNFRTLSYVQVIRYLNYEEQNKLEKSVQ
jgi:rod shape-determining protein MreC